MRAICLVEAREGIIGRRGGGKELRPVETRALLHPLLNLLQAHPELVLALPLLDVEACEPAHGQVRCVLAHPSYDWKHSLKATRETEPTESPDKVSERRERSSKTMTSAKPTPEARGRPLPTAHRRGTRERIRKRTTRGQRTKLTKHVR